MATEKLKIALKYAADFLSSRRRMISHDLGEAIPSGTGRVSRDHQDQWQDEISLNNHQEQKEIKLAIGTKNRIEYAKNFIIFPKRVH